MSQSSDVENLFRRFGGNAADYQEVGREDGAEVARRRWPLLGSLTQTTRGTVPPLEEQPMQPSPMPPKAAIAATTTTSADSASSAPMSADRTDTAEPAERSPLAGLFGTPNASASGERPIPAAGSSRKLTDLFRRLAAVPSGSDTDSSPLRQLASAKRNLP
ncbi:cellulose biosynthesis protein BcsP [Trinickia sp. EG282A]|uniref:cellulose biosynthesis protein BcsP n=1 Tax=Trinickia sp. EG282A TaxID=3237013 RepID=UPI0034D197E5